VYHTSKFHHLLDCLKQSGFDAKNPFNHIGIQTTNPFSKTSDLMDTSSLYDQRYHILKSKLDLPKVQMFMNLFKLDKTDLIDTPEILFVLANEEYCRMYQVWKLFQ